jgi:hypothetical protein
MKATTIEKMSSEIIITELLINEKENNGLTFEELWTKGNELENLSRKELENRYFEYLFLGGI